MTYDDFLKLKKHMKTEQSKKFIKTPLILWTIIHVHNYIHV